MSTNTNNIVEKGKGYHNYGMALSDTRNIYVRQQLVVNTDEWNNIKNYPPITGQTKEHRINFDPIGDGQGKRLHVSIYNTGEDNTVDGNQFFVKTNVEMA